MNLGLWVIRPDLGQPSQTDDHGKNVNGSGNGPIHKRGQFNQSIMGREMGLTVSYQDKQHASSSSMSMFSNTSTVNLHVNK